MHALEGSVNVPAFLTKLWRLVDDESTNDMISWTQGGRSFIIQNQAKFAQDLLPQYYKHNNMASFVRQLNMYGFHKVVSADSGGLRPERDEMEFAHQHFMRGQESLLENIKRKQQRRLASDGVIFTQIPTSRTVMVEDNKNVTKLLNDVRDMKRDQDSMSSKLLNLKRENEALWREYASMRQKFTKQQQIIEKLIHFLIAMVKSPSKGLVPKRKFSHLALEGGEESSSSSSKINTLQQFSQGNPIDILGEKESGIIGGAQIQEVTEDLDSDQDTCVLSMGDEEVRNAEASASTGIKPGTILDMNGEPLEFIEMPLSSDHINATSVQSPDGTILMDNLTNPLLDDAPLSPELLNTVDPSAVTQSFKYPVSCTDPITTSVVCSSGDMSGTGGSNAPCSTSSINTQVRTITQKGTKKSILGEEKRPSEDSSMRIAVPDKAVHKPDFQTHVDDMQSTIDNLQDILSHGNLNLDPSMLYSISGCLPEFWCSKGNASGDFYSNELSVYNPTLLDLADSMEEENEGDPLAFLSDSLASTSTTPSSSSIFTTPTSIGNTLVPTNKSTQPPPPKHLKVTIKKEPSLVDNSLETPIVSPMPSTPFSRGKRHAK
ncbi:heat shock factor protein-like isoform X3 [Eriocheir sinensis]|uniref:heat shock factor protein-like isoform X3 n=1 Tax=Eriocheir sinensis TaxID=95602 RepID=UPI0021C7ACEB|nr:heat shock factor protein-like isoform X3 [Eriocheir sinensis]